MATTLRSCHHNVVYGLFWNRWLPCFWRQYCGTNHAQLGGPFLVSLRCVRSTCLVLTFRLTKVVMFQILP